MVLVYFVLALTLNAKGAYQSGPRPGDIYREYAINLKINDWWRVTDPASGTLFMDHPALM